MMQSNFKSKYKVECKIGEGSFSEVLKCSEKGTGKLVAAKRLKKNFKSSSHALNIPEYIALQKIPKHPNILELLESHFDPNQGRVVLVFELMDRSLYDLIKLRKRPMTEVRAKKYLYQIIKGIDHLHHQGVFHRDIKPENILVKGDVVKISDLGSIKGLFTTHPFTEYISTRWYRSPECLLTRGFYGPKMDIWAAGCVFFELLTLKPLFPGSSEIDQINKINTVLGSPSSKLLSKFRKQKSRNFDTSFPSKKGIEMNTLLPNMSQSGLDVFRQMLIYDPDTRINIQRLVEHRYFLDLREQERMLERVKLGAKICHNNLNTAMEYKLNYNPMMLSFLTSNQKIKSKVRRNRKYITKRTMENKLKSKKAPTQIMPSKNESRLIIGRQLKDLKQSRYHGDNFGKERNQSTRHPVTFVKNYQNKTYKL